MQRRIWAKIRPLLISPVFFRNFAGMLAIAIIGSLSLLAIAVYHYEEQGTAQARITHDLVAQRMAREMGLFFEQAHIQLKITAAYIKDTRPDGLSLMAGLNDLALYANHFTAVTLFDPDRNIISSTTFDPIEKNDAVNEALTYALDKGEPWISPVVLDAGLVPILYMGVPMERTSEPYAALIGTLSLKKLWWWIDQINTSSATALSVVRESDGFIIADKQKGLIGSEHPLWSQRIMGQTRMTADGSAYVSYHEVPNVGLTLVTVSKHSTLSDHLYEIRYELAFTGLALLLTATGIAFIFAWRNYRPVQSLIGTMETYAMGDDAARNPLLPGEYGQIGEAFNQMAEEISAHKRTLVRQESLVFVGRLASSLAHDMRHGLHMIQNIVYMIEGEDDENRQMLRAAVADLTAKIEDLLEFARSGTMSIDDAYVELISEETLNAIRYTEIAQNVALKVENRIHHEMIRLDRVKIVSSLANIMRNAIEAGASEVSLTIEEVGEEVHFTIRDNGPGIPPELHEEIFIPFYSTKKNGFGVGLSIARLIARNHGGDAELVHTGPGGSVFCLRVPFLPAMGEDGEIDTPNSEDYSGQVGREG